MSKARELANLGNAYSDGALSNRNLIINGAMQVAQRGTSFGVLASRAYTIDRWNVDAGVNVQRADLSVDEISEDTRLKYALQLLGNTSSQYFRQPIEDVTQFSSVTCTLSFWIKGSASTTLNNIYARQAFGSGGSSVVDTAFSLVSHSVTTSYTKYTGTVTLPSISGKTLGSGHHLELFMQMPNGVTLYITGVQLEVGDTATPFEHRSYADTLRQCQRYTFRIDPSLAWGLGCPNYQDSVFWVDFPVEMRASPSFQPTGITGFGSGSTEYQMYFFNHGGGGFVGAPTSVYFFSDWLTKNRARIVASHAAGWYNSSYPITGCALDLGADVKMIWSAEL